MNKTTEKEYNGFSIYRNVEVAKKTRYIAVFDGDLDLNGCYGIKNKKELKEYLKETGRGVNMIFKVKFLGRFEEKPFN